jgi:hypothetical protein
MAEKRTIELEVQDNSKSLKQQYREAVQELQKVSQAYGETSEQAVKAAKAAAELKDQIEFSKDLIKGFNPDAKFQAVEGAINGVMNGFQAFEGGLALLGVESDKVQEALLRVQSVMALTQGINGVMQAKDAFVQLGTVARTALKGIKTELIATGIGAFVVALGTVVAYWDDIKEAVSGVSEEQKELNKKVEKQAAASKDIYENAQLQENSLRLQGKTEKEILQIRINKLNTSIADEEARIKGLEETAKLENAAAERNYENAKMFIRFYLEGMVLTLRATAAPIDAILETANAVGEALGIGKLTTSNINKEITKLTTTGSEFFAGLLFDPKETKAKSDATIKEAKNGLAKMKSERDGFLLEMKRSDQQSTSGSIENTKGEVKEKLDLERELIDKRLALMKDGYEKEVAIAKERSRREKEDLLASAKDKIADKEQLAEAEKLIDQTLKKELQELEDKYFSGTLKTRGFTIEALKNDRAKELEIEVQANLEKAAKQKEFDEKEKARIKQLNEYRLNAAKDTLQIFSDLNELFAGKSEKQQKKAFQVQKAINIANAVIDTYKAANTALASSPPPFNYIAMAASITAGLLNVKKIASQQFQSSSTSGGGGGGSVPSAPSSMTANFQTIGTSGINQLATLQQQPVQAYVVSGEVTSAQALDRNRVQNATL